MGHGSSKPSGADSTESDATGDSKSSRLVRLRQKLNYYHHNRHRRQKSGGGLTSNKLLSAEDFAGIALLRLIRSEMRFKDKWLACVSLGEQTYRTHISDQLSFDFPNYVYLVILFWWLRSSQRRFLYTGLIENSHIISVKNLLVRGQYRDVRWV